MYTRPRAIRHSNLRDKCAHGEHKGYVPGEYDPELQLTNPKRYGFVRSWRNPNSIGGPGGLLSELKDFTGHSIRAFWVGREYRVYSYATCIAVWWQPDDPGDGTEPTPRFWVDTNQYSHKTSEHQGLARAWTGRSVDPDIAPSEG